MRRGMLCLAACIVTLAVVTATGCQHQAPPVALETPAGRSTSTGGAGDGGGGGY